MWVHGWVDEADSFVTPQPGVFNCGFVSVSRRCYNEPLHHTQIDRFDYRLQHDALCLYLAGSLEELHAHHRNFLRRANEERPATAPI